MKNTWRSKLVTLATVTLIAACSSTPKVEEKPAAAVPELNVLIEQAAAQEKAGQKDDALRQYAEAAKLYPTAKQPWLRIAQIQFDSGNYGEAIVAAQQVTSRDGQDKVAHSILSVGGLRVSTKALADLSRQNELTGSVRTEAQDLAKVLRENLGERVLVPAPVATPAPVAAPRPVRPAAPSATVRPPATAPTTAARPAAAASAPAGGTTGSPFGALK